MKKSKSPSTHAGMRTDGLPKVRMNDTEWVCALSHIQRKHPDLQLLDPSYYEAGTPGLTIRMVNEAFEATMPPDRRRKLVALTSVRKHLAAAASVLRSHGAFNSKPDAPSAPLVAEVLTTESSKSEPEVVTELTVQHVAASAPIASEQAEADAKKTKVFWTKTEWVEIAEALHRQNPYQKMYLSETLAGLSTEELKAAQREALPPNRHRVISAPTAFREPLLEAFKIVRARIEEEERLAAELETEAAKRNAPPPEPTPAPEAPKTSLAEQVADAMSPFFKVFAKELANAFVPAIENTVLNVLIQMMDKPKQEPAPAKPAAAPVKPVEVDDSQDDDMPPPSDPNAHLSHLHIEPASRTTKIAVIGVMPKQQQDIASHYPELKFVFIERGPNGVRQAIQTCEKIIGMTSHLNPPTDKMLAAYAKGRYCRVSGGTSSVRRQLDVWLSTGAIRSANGSPAHS